MNTSTTPVKRVLISVSDKTGLIELGRGLAAIGVEVLSTGGTAKALRDNGISVTDVSTYTGFPEIMDGRVKTLHPKIHGGILGLRDEHLTQALTHGIEWIDLVVCNLYPFAQTIQQPNVTPDTALENIDIGGPSMIRSAAKNVGWTTVVVDPADYPSLLAELQGGGIAYETRQRLSAKAFGHTAAYDAMIHQYFSQEKFPAELTLPYKKHEALRYGENPHQDACVYREPDSAGSTILNAKVLQGKQLSYNNINDADGAYSLLREFTEPACVIVKHANPCGAAADESLANAFRRAYEADPLSAFGGVIALNRPCTKEIAEAICAFFCEIVIAPSFETEALALLAQKKNLRLLEVDMIRPHVSHLEYRFVNGGLLVQDADVKTITPFDLKTVTKKQPTEEEIRDLLFAWKVVKHMKSNAILLVKNNTTVGIGVGQVSRVDAVDIAIKKAGDRVRGSVLASDAFFPFRDSIDKISGTGITAIIQPGGSIKDEEVIAACDEHKLAMVFTGFRSFKH